MCGITGVLNINAEPADAILVSEMADQLIHRGPDGKGVWVENEAGFGHRRLAVIDLSDNAKQPMLSADQRYVITYNGEIYNFKELRQELISKGVNFQSMSDTEVVVNAFSVWGLECFNRFNGMFAFAIWDRREKILTLARDRYGIKPLYYAQLGNKLLFGSEVKAMLPHPDFKPTMDVEALREYFTFQNLFSKKTLFKGVELLPAGSFLQISTGNKSCLPRTVSYWDYLFEEDPRPLSEGEYIEQLDSLMANAVKRQLVSDVEVSSYLSGGMDSGSITALAAKHLPYIKTFTIGFDLSSATGVELGYDERTKAEQMSYQFRTEHYEMVLKAGDMERAMKDLVWHLEEPRVGQSYPNFYAAKLASKFGKVVLAGTGGDEIFGGYPWRYYQAAVNANFDEYIDKYYQFWQRLIPNKTQEKVFSPVWDQVKSVWTRDIMASVFHQPNINPAKPEEYINHSLYFEAKTFLQGLFIVEDKLSMAHGLESRVPFMDNDLVDFAMKLPVRHKLGNVGALLAADENDLKKYQRTREGKLLLRKAMQRYLPQEVVEREKQGFSAPDASWFKGDSIDYVYDRLIGSKAKIYDFLDETSVKSLVNEHLNGEKNRRLLIWSLLSVEQFCDSFL